MQLMEEEDLRNLLMIGGIQIFLPFAQEEAEICVADVEAATAEAGQPVETVREELEKTLEAAQEEEKMSILRSGSILSARKLRKLQH
jgi:hypothetical protein